MISPQEPTKAASNADWVKTQYANLIRYKPSGKYYARIKVNGKIFKKSLKTTAISVANIRLADLEKQLRQKAELRVAENDAKMTFEVALNRYLQQLDTNVRLKQRSKTYRRERIAALLKSWPSLKTTEVRNISKQECLDWAATFAAKAAASNFNNTAATLRQILDVAVECGVRYDKMHF